MEVKRIGVIGSGLMGRGIAQVSAQAGFGTVLVDVSAEQIRAAKGQIEALLAKDVSKGRLSESQRSEALGRLTTGTELSLAFDADLVIEAVTEKIAVKGEIFTILDKGCPAHTVLATNTSSIPITQLAALTSRPERFVGMHFMNPVPVMKLVELVMGLATGEETLRLAEGVCQRMGKEVVVARKDYPGFIVNRICVPLINEAIWLLHDGMGSVEDIDKGVRLGLNHPMGPLTLADFVGLDTTMYILDIMHQSYGDPKYRPCPLLRQMVQAGRFGRKSGQGFYDYSKK